MLGFKKCFSALLALIIIVCSFSFSVFAADVTPIAEATAISSGKTYSVSTAEEFLRLSAFDSDFESATVLLTADITINSGTFSLSEDKSPLYNGTVLDECGDITAFVPIKKFSGTFDGQGHTISGLYAIGEEGSATGLFAECNGAAVKNFHITDSLFAGGDFTGSICGLCVNGSSIKNVTSDALVLGGKYVGGLIGKIGDSWDLDINYYSSSRVESCFFKGTVSAQSEVGGVAGNCGTEYDSDMDYIDKLYYTGSSGTVYGNICVGGFAGSFNGYAVTCFNSGDVYGQTTVGGFAGCVTNVQVFPRYYSSGHSGAGTVFENPKPYIIDCYTAGNIYAENYGNFCGNCYGDFTIFDACRYKGEEGSSPDPNGALLQKYNETIDFIMENTQNPDPLGMPYIVSTPDWGFTCMSEQELKNGWIWTSFVTDLSNENNGFPIPDSLHKKHVWGEYKLNADGITETANCLCRNCKAKDTRDYIPSSVVEVSYNQSFSPENDYTFKVKGQASKIAFLFSNNSTATYTRDMAAIESLDGEYELWTIHRRLPVNEEIKVRAKFGRTWEDNYKTFTVYLKYQELPFVESVTYTPSFSAENDYILKVNCIAEKVQFINPNGSTATYTKSSVKSVVSYDKNGNEVEQNSKDTAYEIWTIHRTMKTGCEMFVHVKTGGKWESETKAFIIELKKKDVSSIESVTWNGEAVSRNDYFIKVNGQPDKIAFANPDDSTATYTRDRAEIKCYDANGSEVSSDSKDVSYEIWTINRSMKMNVEMRAAAKYGSAWETEMFTFTVK